MEELSFENIMSEEDISGLFLEDHEEVVENDATVANEEENKDQEPVEINPDELFKEESESVDGGDDDSGKGDDSSDDEAEDNTSPKTNFYSSIAEALRDEGILPDLDDLSIKNITDPESFAKAMESQIEAKLDEKQKRIDQALNYGVEVSEIQRYENTISYLESITEEALSDESEKGETLRRQIIIQDYLNRGFSKERAEREATKSFNAGSDLDDAKDALNGNKEFFSSSYNKLIEEAQKADEEIVRTQNKYKEDLKKSLLEDKEVFDGVPLTKKIRQDVWDNLTKPVYKDKSGNYYSAIQKYELENKTDFMKKVGVLFTLTDGFKNIDKLVGKKVKEEKRKSLRELEKTLKSSSVNQGGPLDFISGVSGDIESNINLTLDV